MNTRVINLPLRREQYTGVISGERTIYLPETPYWTKRLYNEDGAKPLQRVNLRLGVSGEPKQYTTRGVSYMLNNEGEAMYIITLDREIHAASKDEYQASLQIALNELIWRSCESVTAYSAMLKLDQYKKQTREYRSLYNEYRHIMSNSHSKEYRDEVDSNARDLSQHWGKTTEAIFQTVKKSIEDMDGENPSTLMHCEAILGLLYADMSLAIHKANGKPKDHAALVEVNRLLRGILDYFAGAYEMGKEWHEQALALLQTELIKYRQLHQWMTN